VPLIEYTSKVMFCQLLFMQVRIPHRSRGWLFRNPPLLHRLLR
jgi:hypothetical protein